MEQKLLVARVPSSQTLVAFECDEEFIQGEKVVIETAFGQEMGIVACKKNIEANAKFSRKATEEDRLKFDENLKKAEFFVIETKKFVNSQKLKMKVFDACLTLDGKKLLVFFTAEGRVDFRELVKVMAGAFKKRIELRQVGPRDELQKTCSVGICGRVCCCGQFLSDFNHVSIKMAKNQGVSLMPNNITGACGKLLCCLEYENDEYLRIAKEMPEIGSMIKTPDGEGKVLFNNLIKKLVEVKVGEERKVYPLETLKQKEKND